MKLSKETEVIKIRGYMGKVEEREGKRIDLSDLELYLVKHGKSWAVYEKHTGKTLVNLKETKRDVMQELEKTLNNYLDKLKELVQKAIEKDGYIKDHALGTWIR